MSKCKPCKNQRKIATLENWVAIDRILFNESHPRKVLKKKAYKKYNKMKSALLYNLHEMYGTFDYMSNDTYDDFRDLNKKVAKKADSIISESAEHLKSKNVPILTEGKKHTKSEKKEMLTNLYKTAIDKFVLENLILEVGNPKLFEDGKPKICLELHKTLRDDLIDLSLKGTK